MIYQISITNTPLLPPSPPDQVYPNQLHLIHPSPSLSDNQHTLSSSSIPLASPCYTKGCPHSLSHSHPHCLHCGTSTACSCAARFPALPARNLPGSAMDSKILQVMRSPSAMRHCTVVHAATRGRPCQCPARSGTTHYSTRQWRAVHHDWWTVCGL